MSVVYRWATALLARCEQIILIVRDVNNPLIPPGADLEILCADGLLIADATFRLRTCVTVPDHSLTAQSLAALESTATPNGDGFGLGCAFC